METPTSPEGRANKSMFSLYAFLDESGDERKDDGIFICGFAGWDEILSAFSTRFGDALELFKVKAVHSTELFSRRGRFTGWTDDQVDDLAGRCIDAIRMSIPIGMAVGLDAKHYRTLTTGQQNMIGRPLLACMSRAIDIAVSVVGEMRARGEPVAGINLAFDDSEEQAVEMLRTWVRLKKARPQLGDSIASVGFIDDERFYPVQAADLLANLTNRYWNGGLAKKPESEMSDLEKRVKQHFVNLLTLDASFPFAYRVGIITAGEMDEAVRLQKRLY
jgi:Protein of unknown function (DUF3800)